MQSILQFRNSFVDVAHLFLALRQRFPLLAETGILLLIQFVAIL
jgi:hypothetical protein